MNEAKRSESASPTCYASLRSAIQNFARPRSFGLLAGCALPNFTLGSVSADAEGRRFGAPFFGWFLRSCHVSLRSYV